MQTNLFLCTSKEADWNQSFVTCGTVGLQFAILNDDSTLNIDLEQVTHALNQLELTEQAWVSGKAFNGSWFWMDSNSKPISCYYNILYILKYLNITSSNSLQHV